LAIWFSSLRRLTSNNIGIANHSKDAKFASNCVQHDGELL
jgi:hypothetical protein